MYLFFKWLHLVAIISWMAGILYLYRLLIYQVERGAHTEIHTLLDLMARRLYRYITVPAMVVSFVGGIGMLVINPGWFAGGWLHVKLLAVAGLVVATLYAGRLVRRLGERAPGTPTSKRLRVLNEVPTLLMMVIVWMAVFKPF